MEILNQFGINPILLAAQVVNFLILLFILKKFLYKPILKVLDERKQKIEDSLRNAEKIEERLAQTNKEMEKILANALDEGRKIINESKELGNQIIEEAKKTSEEIITRATEDAVKLVEREKQVLMQEVRQNLGSLVALVFEKITGKQINKEDQKRIIDKEVKNIS